MTGAALLCQILPGTGQQLGGNHSKDSDGFQRCHQDQKGPPSAHICQRDVECFLWLLWCGTPRVQIMGSNNNQTVLLGCPPSPTWCCAVQETGVVVNRKLAPPSRQCFSTSLSLDSDFFRRKINSCGLPGSLLSWFGSLRLLAVPQTQSNFRQERTLRPQQQPS